MPIGIRALRVTFRLVQSPDSSLAMSAAKLKNDLRILLMDVEVQIIAVRNQAKRLGVDPSAVMDPNGNFLMIPLLSAKATILSALANLENTK